MSSECWRADRLDTRLRQGRLATPQLRCVAAELARLHEGGRVHGGLGLASVFVDVRGGVTFEPATEPTGRDALDDVAALVLGLRSAGHGDLAERFVAAYVEQADAFSMLPALDARTARAGRPLLVAVGGRAASGKSTVAARLASELAAPIVSATRIGGADAWSQFLAMAERAALALDAGRSVVLDAPFASQAVRRAALRLARDRGASFLFVECCASEDTCRRRLASRALAPPIEWEPLRDLDGAIHVVVDTSHAEPRGIGRVRRVLPAAPSLVA